MSTETLPKGEKYLTWKVPVTDDEGNLRLLTPRSDPMEHESPMDLLFDNEGQALSALEDYEAEEEARDEGWVLCERVLTPIRRAPTE